MGGILSAAPFDLVDLFFNFEGFQVIELGFVGLELGVKFVFTSLLLEGRLARMGGGRSMCHIQSHCAQTTQLVPPCRQ